MIYQFLPFYGKFPNYFQTYLDSLVMNADVLRILLFTDIDTSGYTLPPNVSLYKITFEEIKDRAAKFLTTEFHFPITPSIVLKTHYKLCDFRPIYHKLFKDVLDSLGLTTKDYFGWGDCDLIYGKISNFLDITKGYDLIGKNGHFTAMRYDEPYISKYKDIILFFPFIIVPEVKALDERRLIDDLLSLEETGKIKYFPVDHYFCDIYPPSQFTNLVKTFEHERDIEYLIFDKPSGRLYYIFDNGEIRETFYVHLQKRKMKYESKEYSKLMITQDAFLDIS